MKPQTRHSAWLLLALPMCSLASAQNIPSYEELDGNKARLVEWLATNEAGGELYTESESSDKGDITNIALVVDGIDLKATSEALEGPAAWCEFMILHLNVKSCLYGDSDDGQWIRLYMGKKSYQHPDKAVPMELSFASGVSDDAVSWVELKADEGPYGTSDYFIGLYTIAAEEGAYVQITSSQKVGSAAKAAMNIYFKTAARSKVGFSVVGTDKNGEPVYSSGELAALERNVARYLLALREYMRTRHLNGVDGFRVRYAPWFDATEQYPQQLREVDRDDYLRDKEKEYLNQLQLQAEINEQ